MQNQEHIVAYIECGGDADINDLTVSWAVENYFDTLRRFMFTGAYALPEGLPRDNHFRAFITRWLASRGLEVKFSVAYLQKTIKTQFKLIPVRFLPFLRFPRKQEYQMKILAALIASLERNPPDEYLVDVSERSVKSDMSISRTPVPHDFCQFTWDTFGPLGLDVGAFTRACASIAPLLRDV